eukprot:12928034-Prorocentrum_lima.AAC.1
MAGELRESYNHNMGTPIEISQSSKEEFHRTMEVNRPRVDVPLGLVGFHPGNQSQTPSPTV